MTDYICYGCNENCTHSEEKMREMGILVDIWGESEIIDVICPYMGESTEFHEDGEKEEEYGDE